MRRFIVERISDGELLELEFPLSDAMAGPALCAPGHLSGTVDPVVGGMRDEHDNELIVDPGATFIHEELDGIIQGSYWVTHSAMDGGKWAIEGEGFSRFLQGQPFEGEYRGINVELADVGREIWRSRQRFGSSNIGVRVVGNTGQRRGTNSEVLEAEAKYRLDVGKYDLESAKHYLKKHKAEVQSVTKRHDGVIKGYKKTLQDRRDTQAAKQEIVNTRTKAVTDYNKYTALMRTDLANLRKALAALKKNKASQGAINAKQAEVNAKVGQIDARKPGLVTLEAARDAAKLVVVDAKHDVWDAQQSVDVAQYRKTVELDDMKPELDRLDGVVKSETKRVESLTDIHSAAREKAQEDGGAWKILWWDYPDSFDAFTTAIDEAGYEWHEWSVWNADRTKVLKEIRITPRVGRRQSELKFVEGDNISEAVVVEDSLGTYANTIVAIGAGEGRAALRVSVGASDTRRRMVRVVDAKHVTSKPVLERIARAELTLAMQRFRIDGIKTVDHSFARFGTYGIGDEIQVECDAGAHGRVTLWHRVTGFEYGDDHAELTLGEVR